MARRNPKVDINQPEIVKWLRDRHYSVGLTYMVGNSFPDLVIAKHNENILLEVKYLNGKLSEGQEEFFRNWQGPVFEVRTTRQLESTLRGHFRSKFGNRWVDT